LDSKTGERRPTPCRRLRCIRCGPVAALQTAAAIVIAQPEWSAVLSTWGPDVPTEPEQLFRVFVRAVNIVAHDLRSGGRTWEACWVLELSANGFPHAHVLAWGDDITREEFRRAAIDAGMRWGDIEPLRHPPTFAKYILKAVIRALDDPINGERYLATHLALNGNRLVRSSRKFWRNGAEQPLSGLREARAVARKARPPGRRPTPDELTIWHAGWQMPPLPEEDERGGTP
jgi:hypothetical protein